MLRAPAALLAGALALAARGAEVDRFPDAAAAYVVAVDGAELWARAADAPRPPASLTKLMTAIVALDGERPWDASAWVVVSARAAAAAGARAGLRAGEETLAGDALAATLVRSANDACLALAEHVAGSEAAFVAQMNARASALGLGASRFANACGHDAPGHVSSARDLLRLSRAALALPEVRRLVALDAFALRTRGGREIRLRTTNVLLGRLEGARGVKSGYTARAGGCISALAERDGHEVLAVLLDATDRWWGATALVEAAFRETRR